MGRSWQRAVVFGDRASLGNTRVSRAHVGEAIPIEDKKAIEDVACYVVRSALSPKKLVYLDGQKAVLYRSRSGTCAFGR